MERISSTEIVHPLRIRRVQRQQPDLYNEAPGTGDTPGQERPPSPQHPLRDLPQDEATEDPSP